MSSPPFFRERERKKKTPSLSSLNERLCVHFSFFLMTEWAGTAILRGLRRFPFPFHENWLFFLLPPPPLPFFFFGEVGKVPSPPFFFLFLNRYLSPPFFFLQTDERCASCIEELKFFTPFSLSEITNCTSLSPSPFFVLEIRKKADCELLAMKKRGFPHLSPFVRGRIK